MSAPTRTDSNLALAKAMGSKRGYDPMPPDQHEWQRTDGEPPLYRLWSWMCAHTVRNQAATGMTPTRSAFAVDASGRALTLQRASKDLSIDLGQLSKIWARGEEAGLWRRAESGRQLYLNGEVKAAQVAEANKRRQVDCTVKLTPSDLLKINKWAPERKTEFYAIWEPAQQFRVKLEAYKIAEARATFDEIEHIIRGTFALDKVRRTTKKRSPLELPRVLAAFVQSTTAGLSVQPIAVDCTVGEEMGETLTVPASHLYIAENLRETLSESVSQSLLVDQQSRLTDQLAVILNEEWGKATLSSASKELCEQIASALAGAPPPLLRTKLRSQLRDKPQSVKRMGLARNLAVEVGEFWRRGEAEREATAKRHTAQGAPDEGMTTARARAILADATSTPKALRDAREFLKWLDEPGPEGTMAAGAGI